MCHKRPFSQCCIEQRSIWVFPEDFFIGWEKIRIQQPTSDQHHNFHSHSGLCRIQCELNCFVILHAGSLIPVLRGLYHNRVNTNTTVDFLPVQSPSPFSFGLWFGGNKGKSCPVPRWGAFDKDVAEQLATGLIFLLWQCKLLCS